MSNPILDTAHGNPVIDFTAVVFSDVHCMSVGAQGTQCALRIPQLVTAMNKRKFQVAINPGDLYNGNNGTGTWVQQRDLGRLITNSLVATTGSAPSFIHAIGNHCSTWNLDADVLSELGIAGRYYTKDVGAKWRFIVLYSQGYAGDGTSQNYGLGATQLAWFEAQLIQATIDQKFVHVVSHVSVGGSSSRDWYDRFSGNANPVTATTWTEQKDYHRDGPVLTQLGNDYPCIRVWSMGHDHRKNFTILDDGRVKYINWGSCAANYWTGPWYGSPETFGECIHFLDGTISHQHFDNY